MADKKMNELGTASDAAYIYAETSSGEQIRISKADLASVVAGLFTKGHSYIGNIDDISDYMWARVDGSKSAGSIPFPGNWFMLINIPISSLFSIQFAAVSNGQLKYRVKWDGVWTYCPWISL